MARYQVHLETARGHAMAHVLEMPECFVRASGREGALRSLPAAIGEYQRWLRRHREPVPPMDEPLELEVAEEISDLGPFDPGDPAALFESERAPITIREIEACLRLMANSRTDLLEVVGDLSDEVLDWEPAPDAFTIRSVLRHLGNAEGWYVSRVVSPETLPAEWDDDETLAIIDFLDEPAANEEPVPTEDEEVDSQSTEVESAPRSL